MNRLTAILLQVVVIVALAAIAASAAATPAHAATRAVSLADARVAPTYLYYLRAGARVTPRRIDNGRQCGQGYFADTSAYDWTGGALGAQRWNRDGDRTFWRDPRSPHRLVTFDGLTFRNHLRRPVLVAGWCES